MIVVETFVWIDYFNGARTPQVDRLLHDHELLHDDRDFDLLAKHLGLRTVPV